MTLNSELTTMMDKFRDKTNLTDKLSIQRATDLLDHLQLIVNPNLIDISDFGGKRWSGGFSYHAEPDWNDLKVLAGEHNHGGLNVPYDVKEGETYTFSIYAKSSVEPFRVHLYTVYDFGIARTTKPSPDFFTVTKDWQRLISTFKITKSGSINVRIETDVPGTLYLAGYKLEKGDLATPLPEVGGVANLLLFVKLPRKKVAA